MRIKTIKDLEIKGKRVFIRVDFNVPLDDEGKITDDTRIRAALPTIEYALKQDAKVILASHLGRPKGQFVPRYSLRPIAKHLGDLLSKRVEITEDCIGDKVEQRIKQMRPGDVVMLENLRFHPEEEKDDEGFARILASYADVYINEGFAVAHRKNASIAAITRFVEHRGAGFLMKKELDVFTSAVENPARPLVAILGGAKVSTKLGTIENLVDRVDKILIGGAMAFTFLKAMDIQTGRSLVEENLLDMARQILQKTEIKGIPFYLPVDCVIAERLEPESRSRVVSITEIPENWMALDIGPETVKRFTDALKDAKTILWNGPMGAFEIETFSRGTFAMAKAVAGSSAFTVVGGGDTDLAIHRSGESDKISYISTGGGAFVELLEGKRLPAVVALLVKE